MQAFFQNLATTTDVVVNTGVIGMGMYSARDALRMLFSGEAAIILVAACSIRAILSESMGQADVAEPDSGAITVVYGRERAFR